MTGSLGDGGRYAGVAFEPDANGLSKSCLRTTGRNDREGCSARLGSAVIPLRVDTARDAEEAELLDDGKSC